MDWDNLRFWLHLKVQALSHQWPQSLSLGELIPLIFLAIFVNVGLFVSAPLMQRFQKAPVWIDKKKSYCVPGDRIWPHLLWALALGALIRGNAWWRHQIAMPLVGLNSCLLISAVFFSSLPLHPCGVLVYLLLTLVIPLAGMVKVAMLLPKIELELQRLTDAGR